MSERPRARPLAMPAEGHWTIAEEIEFVDLMPPLGSEAGRIRLRVGRANTLDLPLSHNGLVALTNSLLPKYVPTTWAVRRNS